MLRTFMGYTVRKTEIKFDCRCTLPTALGKVDQVGEHNIGM